MGKLKLSPAANFNQDFRVEFRDLILSNIAPAMDKFNLHGHYEFFH